MGRVAALAVGCLVLLYAGVCLGQDGIKSLSDPALGRLVRPPAAFVHDAHNAKAGVLACNVCHHVYSDGRLVSGDDSAGRKCSECHAKGGAGASVSLLKAYHGQCKDCHRAEGRGPLACGGCHKRG